MSTIFPSHANPRGLPALYDPGPDEVIAGILGPPPLTAGEDGRTYANLYSRLRVALRPLDAVEELWVRDVTDLGWEVLRLRRMKARLMEAAAAKGVAKALEERVENWSERQKLVDGWATGVPEARRKVGDLLAAAGIDGEAVAARALAAEADKFDCIDRMIMQAEARRHLVLREVDRHRDAALALRQALAEFEADAVGRIGAAA